MTQDSLNRRQILAAGGLGAAAAAGLPVSALAAPKRLDVLILASVMQDPVGPMVERLSNVTLNNGPYLSSADVIARINAPGGPRHALYCGVTEILRQPVMGAASGDEKAFPIDPAKMPNLADLSDLVKSDVIERDGKTFIIPLFWGFDTVIYNKAEVKLPEEETNTFGLLYDDRFAGRIAWLDQPYYSLYAAALYLGHSAPEKATRAEIGEFAKFMISKKKNVRALWQTQAQAINLMGSGECVISSGQIPIRVTLNRRGMDIATGWPKEGVIVWTEGYFMPKNVRDPAAAQAVLNAVLDPEVGAALTRLSGYPTASAKGAALLTPEERRQAGFDIKERGLKITGYRFPSDLSEWVEAWNRVKSA
ncbi:ABC transporter substrate-binding protein [Enterovirga rhinocerotis]|uniref:Spermidine/putrescine-binding protein n=1 Tax=Enterovirga rhinocerotis TaxID=1339210 RepID=A0A4R7C445_9HYPH|nr:extracellular solute-binding protein [Enterovirga rhinocerotis]TDR92911.1 spermidine/putrescine-binding protein [Enterovirga rhinocerotis]